MSMLAERRRKQKWAVDPRNTAWSNDDSKFGQRMLEKMGWSKGKGLGAQEQGATDHIKVQVKNNHLGLGATINNEDNWIAHQEDFNQLLAELNTCHGQEIADSSDNKEKKSFNLEEKSKISKNRVHYMKFTKGKDLSSRSSVDLDCIFGKRQRKKTTEDTPSPASPEGSEASVTKTSAFTIQEYFAQRMAQLQSKPQHPAPQPSLPETQVEWKSGKKKSKEAAANQESSSQPKAKRSRKERSEEGSQGCRARRREQTEWQPGGPHGDAVEGCAQPPDGQDYVPKLEKRAKDKLQKSAEVAVDATLDDEAPEVKRKQKKKKKKKKKAEEEEEEALSSR